MGPYCPMLDTTYPGLPKSISAMFKIFPAEIRSSKTVSEKSAPAFAGLFDTLPEIHRLRVKIRRCCKKSNYSPLLHTLVQHLRGFPGLAKLFAHELRVLVFAMLGNRFLAYSESSRRVETSPVRWPAFSWVEARWISHPASRHSNGIPALPRNLCAPVLLLSIPEQGTARI